MKEMVTDWSLRYNPSFQYNDYVSGYDPGWQCAQLS
jgi:hypothetical protein